MRQRPQSSRPAIPLLLSASITLVLVAACTTGGAGSRPSSAALPTGLVGPVAPTVGPEALRYVALGDSFTFGDGVRQMDRWPNQLVRVLRPELDLDLVANLAARSVASKQLVEQQLPKLQQLEPGFVSVQVGGNDAYFAYPPDDYAANMRTILDEVLAVVPAERVVVVTTPDFTLTEVEGAADEAEARSARVAELNKIVTQVAADRGIATVDISPVADRVTLDPTLVASDGSHPSAKQYAGWADLIAPTVRRMFREFPARASAGEPEMVPIAPVGPSPDPSLTQLAGPSASPVLITS